MNILQIVSSLEEISGPANALYLTASGLAKKGHKLICVHYVGTQGPLAARLKEIGIEVISLDPNNKRASWIGRLFMVLKLLGIVYKHRIEIIHAHNWDADCYAFLVSYLKKLKVIVTLHSRSYFNWVKTHNDKYRKWFIKKCSKFVCVSKAVKNEFINNCGINEEDILVVYNSPQEIFFKPKQLDVYKKIRDEFKVSESDILLGNVGNFTKFKGIIYLLKCLNILNNDKLKILLVGDDTDKMRPGYDEYLKDKKLKDNVIFCGFREDIPEILDAIDIFVFPSTEEADPIALSEAMAKAKPVIATKISAMAEKIEHQKNGLLVGPEDPGQLAEAIKYYLEDKARMESIAACAKRTMVEKYSYNAMIKAYEQIYQNSLGK